MSHLLGTASGWGGNPRTAALYAAGAVPPRNDGTAAYQLTFSKVPVDAFWSISAYNQAGFFVKNDQDAYAFNSVTATPNADGSFTIHFGGDKNAVNYLPIMPGWNYVVRMYRPQKPLLDGTWKFPEARPLEQRATKVATSPGRSFANFASFCLKRRFPNVQCPGAGFTSRIRAAFLPSEPEHHTAVAASAGLRSRAVGRDRTGRTL